MRLLRLHRGLERTDEVVGLAKALKQRGLFEGLSDGQLQRLVPILRIKEFQDEEIVCHCPDATHDAFLLLEGRVSLSRKRGDALYPLEIEEPGALVNEARLVGLADNYFGARALGRATLLTIDSRDFQARVREDPGAGVILLRNLYRLSLLQREGMIDHLLEGAPG